MTKQKTELLRSVKRDYKSRLFAMIFSEKKELLGLYNAVSGREYLDPEELTITTLDNAIYMSMKNDVSFIIGMRLALYEHQSTYNPNMPLRFLFYVTDMYSKLVREQNLFGSRRIFIQPPKFIVFYNGVEEREDREVLRLSEAYEVKDEPVSLELTAEMININKGHNEELMDACKTLRDYAEYIYRVRKYAEKKNIEEAVEQAIRECIAEDILKEFLEKNRAEAMTVSIYEYNEAEHMRMEREDYYSRGFEDGCREGQKEGHKEGQKQMLHIMQRMTEEGLQEEILRLATEPDFLEKMRKKYNLK